MNDPTRPGDGLRAEPLPFEQVPHWVLYSTVSPQAIRLYLVLRRYADKSGTCWPARRTLARDLGVDSPKTVDRALRELVELGAVTVQPRRDEDGDATSNLYLVRWSGVGPNLSPPLDTDDPTGRAKSVPTGRDTDDTRSNTHLEPHPTEHNPPSTVVDVIAGTPIADAGFDEFWLIYPRREAKAAARKAWDKAARSTPAEEILRGAARYRDDPNREAAYTAHPATWLNAGRWTDDPLPARTASRKSATQTYLEAADHLSPFDPPPAELTGPGAPAIGAGS